MARVLVVDDEEAIRFAFHRFLTDAGYEVLLAEHATEAREILADNEFDVAVIDRILPDGMNGVDLIRKIKKLQPSCEVIMISGFPTFDDSPGGTEVTPFTYLTKPVRRNEILRSVEEAAEKSKSKENVS